MGLRLAALFEGDSAARYREALAVEAGSASDFAAVAFTRQGRALPDVVRGGPDGGPSGYSP